MLLTETGFSNSLIFLYSDWLSRGCLVASVFTRRENEVQNPAKKFS